MAYKKQTRRLVRGAGVSLGAKLGRLAVKKGASVQTVADEIGASRTTVYSWFAGKNVSNAYRKAVVALIDKLQNQ